MRSDSIHSMVTSKCLTIKNKRNRVYVARMNTNGDCMIYWNDGLVGYIKPRGRKSNSFFIQFSQDGLLFKSTIKYSDVMLFKKGEKLPGQKTSHMEAERIMDKEFDYYNGIPKDEKPESAIKKALS